MDLLYGGRRDPTASPKNNKQKGEIGSVSPDQFLVTLMICHLHVQRC